MFSSRSVFEENVMLSCKNSNLRNCPKFEFFASQHRIFLKYCATNEYDTSC